MDGIACPDCRSNLYTQDRSGYVCMDCGYQERIERDVFPPAFLPTERQGDPRQDWLETWSWRRSKALWAKVAPKRPSRKPLTEEQRRLLNKEFMQAKKRLACYETTHNPNDLAAAEKLIESCLRHASAAKRPAKLRELHEAIRAKRRDAGLNGRVDETSRGL